MTVLQFTQRPVPRTLLELDYRRKSTTLHLLLANLRDARLLNDRIDNAWLHEFRKLTEGF